MRWSVCIKIILMYLLSFSFSLPGIADVNDNFNNRVEAFSNLLNKKNLDHDSLFLIISEGLLLRSQLNECIENNEKKLNVLNQILLDKNVENELNNEQKTKIYLEKQKSEILTNVARCKLLLYQVNEFLVRANDLKGNKILFRLFQKKEPPASLDLSFHSLQQNDLFFFVNHAIPLGSLTLLGMMMAILLSRLKINFSSHFSWIAPIQKSLAIWFPCAMIIGYISFTSPESSIFTPIFKQLFGLITIFFLVKICLILTVENKLWIYSNDLKLFFDAVILVLALGLIASIPLRNNTGFFLSPFFTHFRFTLFISCLWLYVESLDWYQAKFKTNFKKMLHMLIAILTMYFVHDLISVLCDYQIISGSAAYFYKALYITLFNFMLCCMIWVWMRNKKTSAKLISSEYFNLFVLSVIYFVSLIFLVKGYFFMAENLIINLIITIILIRIFYNIVLVKEKISSYITISHPKLVKRIRERLGLKTNETPIDISILYLILNLAIFFVLMAGLIISWGGSFNELNYLVKQIQNGFVLFSNLVYPGKIFRALFVFFCLLIVGRLFATHVSNMARFSAEKHTQMTIHSLIRYISFAIALVVSLMISGVNLTHIALITGALSFGLGFGLQHFASDLVSGLFLLVNRPIKIGDHIAVEKDEGFIKKIGLFSTRMSTLEQADLIIPNSMLIIKPVKNFTFENNKLYTVKISVIPEEGANIALCHGLLLDVAKTNPNVVKSSTTYPVVLFDKNMLTLSCTIINVNKKDIILSELSLAIADKFAENKIAVVLS